ncbi:AAA family ATPase [Brachyspira sp. SAP_772]|uniref:AAA family ATPase n=1 Tax=Brachyspira sp. SAP_772 TaxID=2608385 RepID=UPI001E424F01|nr:AAA family ATPase [Brachyspira sp. SAP_772]
MRYWVISPNVLAKPKEHPIKNFINMMEKDNVALMGWKEDKPLGAKFENDVKLGDIIIISLRVNWERKDYFVGIVDSDSYHYNYQDRYIQARKLKKFTRIKEKISWDKNCTNESNQTPPAIYELNKSNEYDKKVIREFLKILNVFNIKKDKCMEEYVKLLKEDYNLILTGAPGTGKTYLAKDIAKEMMKDNENIKDYKEFIREYYNKNKERLDDLKKQGDKLREEFIKKFPMDSLKNISIDDYAIGRGDNNSFCYWIEFGLDRKLLDNFSIGGSRYYILYYDKKTGNIVNETDKPDNELIKEIGEELYNMANTEDYDNQDSVFNKRNHYLAIKIYNTYHPYTYFPMMPKKDMINICNIFGIEKDNDNIYELNKNIKKFFDDNLNDIDSYIIRMILLENVKLLEGEMENINFKETDYGFVQFHPSYDYTDFVEGLRPINNNGNIVFERKDGVFKEFCKKALKNLIDSQKDISELNEDAIIKNNLLKFVEDIGNEIDQSQEKLFKLNSIDPKRKVASIKEIELLDDTTISFDIDTKSNHNIKKSLDGMIRLYKIFISKSISEWDRRMLIDAFGFESRITYFYGFLRAFYEKYNYEIEKELNDNNTVEKIEKKNFVFIIDEINRGEISKIFGELFFAIDPGYRGIKGKVKTQYNNLINKEEDDYFEDGFFVPENVYIIGTMNDIDRSVESMDFAMRRRFAWKEVKAIDTQESILKDLDDSIKKDAIDRMNNLNDAIEKIDGFNSSYHIGASYFLKLKNYYKSSSDNKETAFKSLWENHLKGLLFDYLRGMPDAESKLDELKKFIVKEKAD